LNQIPTPQVRGTAGRPRKVDAVLAITKPLPFSEQEEALFRFIQKLNRNAWEIRQGDVDELHQAGWTDEAVYDAINVCCLFNFYNRAD